MTSGFESIADNMGKIRNRGVEFRLSETSSEMIILAGIWDLIWPTIRTES